RSEDYVNFYNRNTLDVHHFQKVTYHDIYPGIDWVIYCSNGKVKYDFVVRPGADPTLIKMKYEHQDKISMTVNGDLLLENNLGNVLEGSPSTFQDNELIQSNYKLHNGIVSFEIKNYNQQK